MIAVVEALRLGIARVGFDGLVEVLSRSGDFLWILDYPIAVVHSKQRIEDEASIMILEEAGLLDLGGFTPSLWAESSLVLLADSVPLYMQQARMMCLNSETRYPQEFQSKFPKDYWKKLQEVGHIQSVIEWESFEEGDTKCSVEFALREVMRKRKEVNVLKKVAYVWIAAVPKTLMVEEVMRHYFADNVVVVEREGVLYHIGWNDTLKDINMRYFVCPPS